MNVFYCRKTPDDTKDASNVLSKANSDSPGWWKKLTAFIFDKKSIKQVINDFSWPVLLQHDTYMTAKGCPALQNFFKHNVLVKFPCDFLVETGANGDYKWKSNNKEISLTHHDPLQYPGISQDYMVLKFILDVNFTTDKPAYIQFLDPVFYNTVHYKVSPGLVQTNPKQCYGMHVVCFFPKIDARYYFEQGDVIATLQLSEPVKKITQKDLSKLPTNSIRSKFFNQHNQKS